MNDQRAVTSSARRVGFSLMPPTPKTRQAETSAMPSATPIHKPSRDCRTISHPLERRLAGRAVAVNASISARLLSGLEQDVAHDRAFQHLMVPRPRRQDHHIARMQRQAFAAGNGIGIEFTWRGFARIAG